MKFSRLILLLVVIFAFNLPALAQDGTPEATTAAPAKITINVPGIQPEGIEYDAAHQRFLISSLTDGKIRQVADDGTTSVFIDDPNLHATDGIQIDAPRNRLLVDDTGSGGNDGLFDLSNPGRAGLGAYDLDTGKQLFYVDLGSLTQDARHWANDLTVDADGNAYVTDSLAPVIYKVDPQGHATVLVRDDRFSDPVLGLNGIDYDPAGYLLVSQFDVDKIYKVPLDDPSSITEVMLSERFAADGMEIGSDGVLYTVAYYDSGAQSILALTSNDDWASASITASVGTTGEATTLALRDGVPYYINSYLSSPDFPFYQIVRADLKPR